MLGVLGLLARLVDDGPVGRHVVFPRNSYPRAFRTECPFVAFLHLTRGLEADSCTAQVSVDHMVKTHNKHIPPNLEPRLIAARPSILLRFLMMGSGAKCEVNLLINSCLVFSAIFQKAKLELIKWLVFPTAHVTW